MILYTDILMMMYCNLRVTASLKARGGSSSQEQSVITLHVQHTTFNPLLSERSVIAVQSQELLPSFQFDGIISLGKGALHFFQNTYSIHSKRQSPEAVPLLTHVQSNMYYMSEENGCYRTTTEYHFFLQTAAFSVQKTSVIYRYIYTNKTSAKDNL